jgi:hypothetical protein
VRQFNALWLNELCRRLRSGDEHINVSVICESTGKGWDDYFLEQQTQEFLDVLGFDTRLSVQELVEHVADGDPHEQGVWVHRRVAIHLATWCSPEFRLWVLRKLNGLPETFRAAKGMGGAPEPRVWVHPLVGIDLAMWCSPRFAVWAIGKIDKLLTRSAAPRRHRSGG